MDLFNEAPLQRFAAETLPGGEQGGNVRTNASTSAEEAPARRDPSGFRPKGYQESRYSIQQESYRSELAYGRRRERARKALRALRTVLAAVGIPVLLVAIFIGSYALTCILDGATPEEVGELLALQVSRLQGLFASFS